MKLMLPLRQNRIVGLDIDEGSVIATQMIREKDRVQIGEYKIASNLKELIEEAFFKEAGVVINVPAQVVLFRSFHIAGSLLNSKNKQKDIIAFLTRQNLPFKLEDCFWATFIWNSNLNLLAAKKEVVEKYIAQVREMGLRCWGVIPSFVALYNVFIYNYPEKGKDSYAILNIRNSASDLLIYQTKQLWIYPLSMGRLDLKETEGLEKFSIELQRIFNAHYLQNPSIAQKRITNLAFSGPGDNLRGLILALKNTLTEFEITVLEPLKKIMQTKPLSVDEQQAMALSIGLGLTYLKLKSCLDVNLIREKLRQDFILLKRNLLKRVSLSFGMAGLMLLFLLNINLLKSLKEKSVTNKNMRFLVSSALPEAKVLKTKKERLKRLKDYLERKLTEHKLYLKVLTKISQSKPKYIQIQEIEAKMKEKGLLINLAASAPTYEEVNNFLNNLKKDEDIREVKIVFSTFPTEELKPVNFKLRFEAE